MPSSLGTATKIVQAYAQDLEEILLRLASGDRASRNPIVGDPAVRGHVDDRFSLLPHACTIQLIPSQRSHGNGKQAIIHR